MKGTVFSIEEFSVYDGPGVRTSVFLKGCPLRCTWCHNPEGQKRASEILRSPNGCLGCLACEKKGFSDAEGLHFTAESIAACPRGLLRVSGEEYEDVALCERLLKHADLLSETGGGVTFSGGEPFMQKEFLFSCLSLLRGRVHTAIQTSGYTDRDSFERALLLADYFLYDLKIMDDACHRRFTGVSNARILDNFKALAASGVPFCVRTPLIPGVSDTEENMRATAEFLKENGVEAIELLPYNKMAGGKYKMLLRQYEPQFDETAAVAIREDIFKSYQIRVTVM